MNKSKLLALVCMASVFMLAGCATHPTPPVDGVHKVISKNSTHERYGVSYLLIKPKPDNLCFSMDSKENNDEVAVKSLLAQAERGESPFGCSPFKDKLSFFVQHGKTHVDGAYKLSSNGMIENSIFLKIREGEIVEKIANNAPSKKLYGVTDPFGRIIIEPVYDELTPIDDVFFVSKNGKEGILDKNGSWLLPLEYEWIGRTKEGRGRILKDGKWGYIDASFKVVIPPRYDWAEDFTHEAAAVKQNDRWFFIDPAGKRAVKGDYPKVGPATSVGLYAITLNKDDKVWSFIDRDGKIQPFTATSYKSKKGVPVLALQTDRGWVAIDKNGRPALPYYFSNITFETPQVFIVKINGKHGVMNEKGAWIVPPEYSFIFHWENTYHVEAGKGKKGILDGDGKVIIPPAYGNIYAFKGGFYQANQHFESKMTHIFDMQGNQVGGDFMKASLNSENEGCLRVQALDKKWGLIDKQGQYLLKPSYDYIDCPHEGVLTARIGMKSGAVKLDGSIVLPFEYNSLDLKSGLFVGAKSGKRGVLDLQGKIIVPFEYDRIGIAGESIIASKKDGHYVFMDNKGRRTGEGPYTFLSWYGDHYIASVKNRNTKN